MNAVQWFDAAPFAGFGRIVATSWAFRSILHTMMPPSFVAEFFEDRELLQ